MLTTITTLPPEVQASVDDVLLAVRTPHAIHNVAALPKRLKDKGGTTIRMSRFDRLPTAPVPLGPSGSTPPATPLNRVDVDATVSFYGYRLAVVKSSLIDLEAEVALS
jgi:hypothetical protein